jgi:hypothetical protein
MASLRAAYDYTVIDSSAILGGLDVPLLRDAADGGRWKGREPAAVVPGRLAARPADLIRGSILMRKDGTL